MCKKKLFLTDPVTNITINTNYINNDGTLSSCNDDGDHHLITDLCNGSYNRFLTDEDKMFKEDLSQKSNSPKV